MKLTREQYIQKVSEAKASAMHGADRSCASCEFLTDEGFCTVHNQFPPLEFISVQTDCDQHTDQIPF